MDKAPLSFIFARILLVLGIGYGLYGLLNIELISVGGLIHIAVLGLLCVTLVCLFTDRNLGRLLSVAVFTFSGLMAAIAAVAASAAGIPISLAAVDVAIATVYLTLAWHLLVGAPAREYADQEPSDVRT
jgi:hypothetical protein